MENIQRLSEYADDDVLPLDLVCEILGTGPKSVLRQPELPIITVTRGVHLVRAGALRAWLQAKEAPHGERK